MKLCVYYNTFGSERTIKFCSSKNSAEDTRDVAELREVSKVQFVLNIQTLMPSGNTAIHSETTVADYLLHSKFCSMRSC